MVPNADCGIRTCGGKGVVGWVECKRVDRPDVVYIVDGLPMALESIFFILGDGGGIEVFNSYPAFYRCSSIAYVAISMKKKTIWSAAP